MIYFSVKADFIRTKYQQMAYINRLKDETHGTFEDLHLVKIFFAGFDTDKWINFHFSNCIPLLEQIMLSLVYDFFPKVQIQILKIQYALNLFEKVKNVFLLGNWHIIRSCCSKSWSTKSNWSNKKCLSYLSYLHCTHI